MANKPTYEELEQRVQKLEESERELIFRSKQLESLMNNNEVGIVSLDNDMRIVGCNEAFEDLFLYDGLPWPRSRSDYVGEVSVKVPRDRTYSDCNPSAVIIRWESAMTHIPANNAYREMYSCELLGFGLAGWQ